MSKRQAQKPYWWQYAKLIIMDYPALCKEERELRETTITPVYGDTGGHSSEISKPTEQAVTRELPTGKRRKLEAVRYAIKVTAKLPGGEDHLKVIKLVYWDKTHTIAGAAITVPCGEASAQRWQADFVRLVGKHLRLP